MLAPALLAAVATIHLLPAGTATALSCGESLPPAAGYYCAAGFCGGDGPHPAPPKCGPAAELKLGGTTPAERVQYAKRWCDTNSTCTGFAIDPSFAITLAFSQRNLTTTAQPNAAWSIYWKGPAQPLPPAPPAPAPPSPWQPILPKGPCSSDEHCSLNGICAAGKCLCTASWRGHNCQYLALQPVPKVAGYGWNPNISSWGGSIYHNASDSSGLYHLYVTEETDGKGLNSWISNSQIIHAVATTPLGPYRRKDVVSKPATTNPQIVYDPRTGLFLLFHIRGAGSFQLFVSPSVDGPWTPRPFHLGGCNNPTAAFHPNGTLYVLCHDSQFSLHGFHPTASTPAWEATPAPAIGTLKVGKNKNVPGNCEGVSDR